MKTILLFISLLGSFATHAQINIDNLEQIELTESIKYKGDFISGFKWTDSAGINTLVLSQKVILDKNEHLKRKDIYAYQYVTNNDSTFLLWKLWDFQPCQGLDLTLKFREQEARITDLDKNGITETWLIYLKNCSGGITEVPQKIIMHQGKQKYAIRGTVFWAKGSESGMGPHTGEYKYDNAFDIGDKHCLDYGISLWQEFKYFVMH